MATVSYLYTAETEGSSANIADLTDGILKFAVAGGVATPATAVPSDTGADNDYVPGSASLSNIAALPATLGSFIVGTGDGTFWDEITPTVAGSIMSLSQVGPEALPGWLTPGTLNQVLTITADTPDIVLGWATPVVYFSWVSVAGTSQAMAANTGYFSNNVALTTYTLPASATVGDSFEVVGPALWIIEQNAGQEIIFGDTLTTIGVGGSIASTNTGDTIRFVCSDATPGAEVFRVLSAVGELTIV